MYTSVMLRVSEETRKQVQRLAREEFGGASADETIRRLLEEHWERAALAGVEQYRTDNPQGWAEYLGEADDMVAADAPITDDWSPR